MHKIITKPSYWKIGPFCVGAVRTPRSNYPMQKEIKKFENPGEKIGRRGEQRRKKEGFGVDTIKMSEHSNNSGEQFEKIILMTDKRKRGKMKKTPVNDKKEPQVNKGSSIKCVTILNEMYSNTVRKSE